MLGSYIRRSGSSAAAAAAAAVVALETFAIVSPRQPVALVGSSPVPRQQSASTAVRSDVMSDTIALHFLGG